MPMRLLLSLNQPQFSVLPEQESGDLWLVSFNGHPLNNKKLLPAEQEMFPGLRLYAHMLWKGWFVAPGAGPDSADLPEAETLGRGSVESAFLDGVWMAAWRKKSEALLTFRTNDGANVRLYRLGIPVQLRPSVRKRMVTALRHPLRRRSKGIVKYTSTSKD